MAKVIGITGGIGSGKSTVSRILAEKLNADFVLPSFIDEEKILEKKDFNVEKMKIITLSKLIKRKNIDLKRRI